MKVLLITQHFPPAAGSGVLRGAKFVKYLLREGWEVDVVAIDPSTSLDRDESLLDDVSGARVSEARLSRLPGVEHQVLRALPSMRRAIMHSIARGKPDVMLATAPDFHWSLAASAARRHRIPLVVDYPDPWTVLPTDFRLWRPAKLRSRMKWWLAPSVERRVLRVAQAAMFATEPILDEYTLKIPRMMRIGRVISNGFDPEDFAGTLPEPSADQIRISHVGSFAGPRSPIPAARATKRAIDELALDPTTVDLSLVGAGAEQHREALESELGGIRLRLTGWVSHARAIEEMATASVLWLDSMVHLRSAATGKVYEYLASGRPVLAVAHPRSPAAELIRRFDAGEVVSSEAPDLTGPALARLIASLPTAREPLPGYRDYDRRATTERLAAVLRAVAEAARR